MIKASVIGLGKMGISHTAIVNAHPNVHLVAVCDTSSLILDAFKKYSKINCYSNFQKMLESEDLDCVIVATPTKSHFPIVKNALDRGLHVFCEKPFSLEIEEGEALVKLAESKNVVNQVGYHNRFLGTFNELNRLIKENIIGEIYHFMGEAYGPVIVKEKAGNWRTKRSEGGGCLFDYASHVIDLIHFILGKTKSVSGTMLKSTFSKEVEDTVYSSVFLENGLSGQLAVNWSDDTHRKMSTSITIWGTKGKIICDATELKIYLKEDNNKEKLEKGWTIKYLTDLTPETDFYLRGEEYSNQISYFFNSIQQKNPENKNSFESAFATDQTINLLLKNSINHG